MGHNPNILVRYNGLVASFISGHWKNDKKLLNEMFETTCFKFPFSLSSRLFVEFTKFPVENLTPHSSLMGGAAR